MSSMFWTSIDGSSAVDVVAVIVAAFLLLSILTKSPDTSMHDMRGRNDDE